MAPPHDVVALTNNGIRRIAASHIPALPAHGLQPLRLAQNVRDGSSQDCSGQIRLRQEHSASGLRHHFRVA